MLSQGLFQTRIQLSSRRCAGGEESGFGKGVARRCRAAPDSASLLVAGKIWSGQPSKIPAALKSHTPCNHFSLTGTRGCASAPVQHHHHCRAQAAPLFAATAQQTTAPSQGSVARDEHQATQQRAEGCKKPQ